MLETYRIRHDLRHHGLGLFQNLANKNNKAIMIVSLDVSCFFACMRDEETNKQTSTIFTYLANVRRIAIGLSLLRVRINAERFQATTTATRVSLGTTIDTSAAATRGSVHHVQGFALVIGNGKGGDTAVAAFLDVAKCLSTRGNGGLLVAAALARACWPSKGTFNRQEFRFGIVLLDRHGKTEEKGASEENVVSHTYTRVIHALVEQYEGLNKQVTTALAPE